MVFLLTTGKVIEDEFMNKVKYKNAKNAKTLSTGKIAILGPLPEGTLGHVAKVPLCDIIRCF